MQRFLPRTAVRVGLSFAGLVCVFAGSLSSQSLSSSSPSTRAAQTPQQTIRLIVPIGTPIQIALDREVQVRKVGQPINGRVMQPIYVFDRVVIPIGTTVTGTISAIEPSSRRTRTLSALNADFTPSRKIAVSFEELLLPNGPRIPLHANVVPDSGQVVRLVTADERKANRGKDTLAKEMDQARAQWNSAMKKVESPDRTHTVLRYAEAQLPIHSQYLSAGTLYSADITEPIDFGTESISPTTLSSIGAPPPESLVHAVLVTPLSSATTVKGADVEAVLSQPLLEQDRLILPAGTRLRGTALQVRPARGMHRNGQLRINFQQMILPEGTARQVDTLVEGIQSNSADNAQLDSEGGTKSTPSKTRYLSTGVSVGLGLIGGGGKNDVGDASPIAGGASGFKLIGMIVGIAFRSHTYGILMSAYGGGRSIYTNFLGKGREITFPKDTMMDVSFGDRPSRPLPIEIDGTAR